MLDLAIAYRIYPGVSKVPAIFADDKFKLSTLCLQSFKRALGPLRIKMWVLLDGCPPIYEDLFRAYFRTEELEILNLDKIGNLPTFSMQIDILAGQTEADLVYFAEDDYFYLPDALVKMVTFARNNRDADFVTPYDHPGNYDAANGTEGHLIRPFEDRHWRTSIGSCLTFLAKRDALIRTRDIFETYSQKNDDGSLWLSITQKLLLLNPRVHWSTAERRKLWLKAWFWGYRQILFSKRRRLWLAIPSLATHIESPCLAPVVDWYAEFDRAEQEALATVSQLTREPLETVTTSRERLILLKNAGANVVRGSTAALVALALPPFLTRSMSPAAFGAWALVLQLSAYVSYLDFGVQTAVGRFVAHANERNDPDHRDKIVNTSLAVLTASGLVAWIGALILAMYLPQLFRQLPLALVDQVRIAFIVVAGSLAVGLPASVFIGIFVGLQHNSIPAAIIGVSKIISALLVVLIARHGGGLAQMGTAVAAINLASYSLQYYACRRIAPDMRYSLRYITRSAAKELAEYCFSLTIWALGLLLVTGLDLSIVGFFRFNEVAYYSVAAILVTFIGGFYNAIISPMIPATAVLHARGDRRQLARMVMVATRYGMLLLLLTGLPLIMGARFILKIWVGHTYSAHAASIAQILVAANIIRLCVTPYVVAMIGSGEQRRVILTPILEGVSNLICSLIAGYFLGALGVAIGTMIGAVVGLLGMLFYNIRRTTAIQLTATEYIRSSLLRPCFCAFPVLTIAILLSTGVQLHPLVQNTLQAVAVCISFFLLWTVGLESHERQNLIGKVLSKVR